MKSMGSQKIMDSSIPATTRTKLTPTQLRLYQELTILIKKLPVLIFRGERFTGKNYVVRRALSRLRDRTG